MIYFNLTKYLLKSTIIMLVIVISHNAYSATGYTLGRSQFGGEWFDGAGTDNPSTPQDERIMTYSTVNNKPLSTAPVTTTNVRDLPDMPDDFNDPESRAANTSHGFDITIETYAETDASAGGRQLKTSAYAQVFCCDLQTDANDINVVASSAARFEDSVRWSDAVQRFTLYLNFDGELFTDIFETEQLRDDDGNVIKDDAGRSTFIKTNPQPPRTELAELLDIPDFTDVLSQVTASAWLVDPNDPNANLPSERFEDEILWSANFSGGQRMVDETLALNFFIAGAAFNSYTLNVQLNSLVDIMTFPGETSAGLIGSSEFQNTLEIIGIEVFGENGERLELADNFESLTGFDYSLTSPIPIPAGIWLLASAFIALFSYRKK